MRNDIKHIIDRLKSECQFDNMSNEKDSFYKLITCSNECIVELRISNHKTDLNTWAERKYKKGLYPHIRISVVFRENDFENVTELRNSIRKPILVTEWVYDLRNSTIDDDTITKIRDVIRNINSTMRFSDAVGTAEKPYNVVSKNPANGSKNQNNNNQETNENKIMNKKQVIRLTESQLHQIVKETVKKVLNEGVSVNNKPFFKKLKDDTSDGVLLRSAYPNEFLSDTEVFWTWYKMFGEKLRELGTNYKENPNNQTLEEIKELYDKLAEISQKAQIHNNRVKNTNRNIYPVHDEPNHHLLAQQRRKNGI